MIQVVDWVAGVGRKRCEFGVWWSDHGGGKKGTSSEKFWEASTGYGGVRNGTCREIC